MSDSEQEESIQSYDSENEDIDFKEDYDDEYQEPVKPKIKIGALIDEDVEMIQMIWNMVEWIQMKKILKMILKGLQ